MLSSAPFPNWSTAILNARLEFRSMFLATVFLFVVLFLAYLSNPSETSFRSYLTEQSFRHHLSRLDDPSDDQDHSDSEDSGVHYRPGTLESGSSAFHFSSRASIALRTPRHAFHSFAFFTIAAVIPTPRSTARTPAVSASASDLTGSQTKEAWFIGAFGRWWRGALIDASWPPKAKSEEEGWSSGILNVKAVDKLEIYNGLPFSTTTSSQRPTPPKLRSRDRSAQRQPRTASPPPLPKSATLPLHTPRHSQSLTVPASPSPPSHPQPPPRTPNLNYGVSPPPPLYDTTPAIAELLRQIAATRTLNHELRGALSEHAASTASTDAALAAELHDVREAKRVEDTARAELKSRTKTLEEAKRAAEAGRREAERRLRVARAAQENAGARVRALGEEIEALETNMRADEERVSVVADEAWKEEQEVKAKLKRRRQEVRVAEEVVSVLGVRVRELEEAVEREREAVAAAREKAEALREETRLLSLSIAKPPSSTSPRSSEIWDAASLASAPLPAPEPNHFAIGIPDPFPTLLEKDSEREHSGSAGSPHSREVSASPRPKPLNLLSISNLTNLAAYSNSVANGSLSTTVANPHDALARRAKGYAIFDDDIASLSTAATTTAFSPFGDDVGADIEMAKAPFISSGLIQSLDSAAPARTAASPEPADDMLSKSFQSDSDAFLERDWRRRAPDSSVVGSHTHPLSVGSPATTPVLAPEQAHTHPHVHGHDEYDPFEVRSVRPRQRLISDPIESQRSWLIRANSDPVNGNGNGNGSFHSTEEGSSFENTPSRAPARRWWSSSVDNSKDKARAVAEREHKGLNPDAKVFRFSRKPLALFPPPATPLSLPFDSLNPSVNPLIQVPPRAASPGFFSSLAMRAFAPSPAEREALQRALGGSTNTSLERLPSLSEVGSIPASPTHTHAHAQGMPFDMGLGTAGGGARSWLQGLTAPRGGKIRFSPWGDGEDD